MKITKIQAEVIRRNELIAVFDGWYRKPEVNKGSDINWFHHGYSTKLTDTVSLPFSPRSFQYESSWDWLMPVAEKIGGMMIDRFPITVSISPSGIYIGYNHSRPSGEVKAGKLEIVNTLNINYFITDDKQKYTMRESVWFGISQFIEWYNKKMSDENNND